MDTQTILVVEDDPQIRRLLRRYLEADGFLVHESASERDVISELESNEIDLVTLDLNLGAESGLQVIKAIREISDVPVIIVSGKGDVIDRVVGLELGADDYISKPFHMREVVARVRTVLRRTTTLGLVGHSGDASPPAQDSSGKVCKFDGLTVYLDRYEVIDRDGAPADLTRGDFRLLQLFLESPGRVLSRDNIMDRLNGLEWSPLDRTIDNQVARLRKKIERDPANPRLIKTVRGVGYTLAATVERV